MPWEASRELLNHAFELLRETASYLLFVAHLGSQSRNRTSHTAVYADRLAKRGYDLSWLHAAKKGLMRLGRS
jgi:arabinogalactan endo-1,4-beta-galactosidase